ncbi:MAG: hypothetical protein RI995_849, partial [Bacteroidota bacterium]
MGNISIEPIVKFVLKFKVNILSLFILFLLSIVLKFEIPFLIGPESDGIILLAFFLFWGSLSPTNNTQKYYFILGFSLVEALVLINIQKIKGLDFPLTFYDLTYIGSNPMILFSSIGLSQNESIGLLLILVISIIYLVYFFYFRNKSKINIVFYILIYFLFGYVSLKGFSWINKKYSRDTYLSWKQKDAIEPFVQVNKRLGTLGFLSFSSNDSIQKSDLFSIYHIKLKNVSQPQKINRFLNDSTYHKQLPNIVFFLAESTFNPNTIFEYKAPISDNYLFREKNEFEKNQILFVSAIGGGTWKSEFEILTGLDSRAFGFLGQYTHSYLSQRLINSFPRYLSNNGYHTTAFYPVDGKFYGASFGYKNYGFKNFYDSEDLGLDETNWKTFSDFVMVQKSFKKWTSQSPFFYTYVSLKNHSPHNDCSDNNRKFDFFDTNDQNINCVMDVYLNRALDTEKAIYSIKNELE